MDPRTSQRRSQGWRGQITPSAAGQRIQLVEVHAEAPSVLTISYDITGSPNIDDAGTLTIQTRVDEATRERRFTARIQGHAMPVPQGVTRVWCEGFAKGFGVQIQLARGVAVTERTPGIVDLLPAGNSTVYAAPAYARQCLVTCLAGQVDVTSGPGGGWTWRQTAATPSNALWIPAYGSVTVTDMFGANGSVIGLSWEVTS